jgi:repressor LexA
MIGLTARQLAVLRFVTGYIEAKGYCPSLQEITAAIGLKSRSGAHTLVMQLEDRECVRTLHSRNRSIRVLKRISIPRTPEGQPLYFVKVPQ